MSTRPAIITCDGSPPSTPPRGAQSIQRAASQRSSGWCARTWRLRATSGRTRDDRRVSDADIALRQVRDWTPLDTTHVSVNTDQELDVIFAALRDELDRRLRGELLTATWS